MTADAETTRALARARALVDLDRGEAARELLAKVLAVEPGNAYAYRLLAWSHIQARAAAEAKSAAARAIALDPDHEYGHRLFSIACRLAGEVDTALAAARRAVALAPQEYLTHVVLSSALAPTDAQAALAAARQAVTLAPDMAESHIAAGQAAFQAGHFSLAEESFREALRIDPAHAVARNNLAVVALRRRRMSRALAGFRAALAMNPRLDLARRALDTTATAMLVLLRAVMVITACVALFAVWLLDRHPAFPPGDLRVACAASLAMWCGLIVWGLSRVPRSLRRYLLNVVRRQRRAAWNAGAALAMILLTIIGPLLRLVPALPADLLGIVVAGVVGSMDNFRVLSRRRRSRAARGTSSD